MTPITMPIKYEWHPGMKELAQKKQKEVDRKAKERKIALMKLILE